MSKAERNQGAMNSQKMSVDRNSAPPSDSDRLPKSVRKQMVWLGVRSLEEAGTMVSR